MTSDTSTTQTVIFDNTTSLTTANSTQISEVVGSHQWQCEKCTFMNAATELHCTICYFSRIEVKDLSAQWQWQAADRWITYDVPSTIQIEDAFKSGANEIILNCGWFAAYPDVYSIIFQRTTDQQLIQKTEDIGSSSSDTDPQPKKIDTKQIKKRKKKNISQTEKAFVQINNETKNERKVRRIAMDDETLFIRLTLNDLEKDSQKCMVCLYDFTEDDENDGVIVQLSTCFNHGFHRKCIAQWVQLKGNCPLCRQNINTELDSNVNNDSLHACATKYETNVSSDENMNVIGVNGDVVGDVVYDHLLTDVNNNRPNISRAGKSQAFLPSIPGLTTEERFVDDMDDVDVVYEIDDMQVNVIEDNSSNNDSTTALRSNSERFLTETEENET